MAASVAGRDMELFTYGDTKARDDVQQMHRFLVENQVKVCDLFSMISDSRGKTLDENFDLQEHIRNSTVACSKNRVTVMRTRRAKGCCSFL